MLPTSFAFIWIFVACAVRQAGAAKEDMVNSGNYLIYLCNASQPDSDASSLQALLPRVYDGLQAVIADAELGTSSRHGYASFFKTNDSIAEVLKVYQDIAAGRDSSAGINPGRTELSSTQPMFMCINDVPETEPIYQVCTTEDQSGFPISRIGQSDMIAICPRFWDIREMPVPRLDCPRVGGSKLYRNNMDLSINQQAMIVYVLVALFRNNTVWPPVMKIQDAVDLNASASLANANSHALYYAGTFQSHS